MCRGHFRYGCKFSYDRQRGPHATTQKTQPIGAVNFSHVTCFD